jgi:hypothetical protein
MNDVKSVERSAPVRVAAGSPVVLLMLIGILIIGAALRFVGLNWDDGHLLHPDARFLAGVTSSMQPVTSLSEYFDTTTSTLNPNNVGFGFYVYGNFPIIVVRYVGEMFEKGGWQDYYVQGRIVSSISDLLTIIFIFLAGRHLWDERAGLIAAALYAVTALAIQLSHFYTVDTMTTLFVTSAFYFAVRLLDRHNWPDYLLFGLTLGLAMSSKVSIFPFAFVLILALLIRVWRQDLPLPETLPGEDAAAYDLWKRGTSPDGRNALIGLALAGIVTVLVFRVGQPYAFLPPNSDEPVDSEHLGTLMTVVSQVGNPIGFRPNSLWLDQMSEVRRQVSGYWAGLWVYGAGFHSSGPSGRSPVGTPDRCACCCLLHGSPCISPGRASHGSRQCATCCQSIHSWYCSAHGPP